MKIRWRSTVAIIIVTGTVLFAGRKNGIEFSDIDYSRTQLQINLSKAQQISGMYNSYFVYNDIKVSSYEDLLEVSDYVVCVEIRSLKQDNDAIFTEASICDVIKDASNSFKINDSIVFLQPNVILPNEYGKYGYKINTEKPVQVKLESPCTTTRINERYIVYLNSIDLYDDVFRLSTILYSIVPMKNEIVIQTIESKNAGKMKYDISKTDYLAITNEDENIYLDEIAGRETELAIELSHDYVERYKDICNKSLLRYGLKPF